MIDKIYISFHDSVLTNIDIDANHESIVLSFDFESGGKGILKMCQVVAFRCEDLVTQNIVNKIYLSSKNDFSYEYLNYWINWATRLSDTKSWLVETAKEQWLKKIDLGDLELIYIEPSLGARIAIVCSQLFVET